MNDVVLLMNCHQAFISNSSHHFRINVMAFVYRVVRSWTGSRYTYLWSHIDPREGWMGQIHSSTNAFASLACILFTAGTTLFACMYFLSRELIFFSSHSTLRPWICNWKLRFSIYPNLQFSLSQPLNLFNLSCSFPSFVGHKHVRSMPPRYEISLFVFIKAEHTISAFLFPLQLVLNRRRLIKYRSFIFEVRRVFCIFSFQAFLYLWRVFFNF